MSRSPQLVFHLPLWSCAAGRTRLGGTPTGPGPYLLPLSRAGYSLGASHRKRATLRAVRADRKAPHRPGLFDQNTRKRFLAAGEEPRSIEKWRNSSRCACSRSGRLPRSSRRPFAARTSRSPPLLLKRGDHAGESPGAVPELRWRLVHCSWHANHVREKSPKEWPLEFGLSRGVAQPG